MSHQVDVDATDESDALSLIDCDIHQSYRDREEIAQYLHDRYDYRGVKLPRLPYENPGGIARKDSERAIMYGNAQELYGLPDDPAALG